MLRKRIIFALIYNNNYFMQSRNFRLQKVGNIHWLEKNYKFQDISFSLDELLVLDATRELKNIDNFCETLKRLASQVFIPLTAGGGIRSMKDAKKLFKSGADKLVINTILTENITLVSEIIDRYGSQSIVASIDYKNENGKLIPFINDGQRKCDIELKDYLLKVSEMGVGEIMLNSIDKDGTGFGYDLDVIKDLSVLIKQPLIIMGGAGNKLHLEQGVLIDGVSAVATANLFNFIGNSLPNSRDYLLEKNYNLAKWR